jgi:hypothetical protein
MASNKKKITGRLKKVNQVMAAGREGQPSHPDMPDKEELTEELARKYVRENYEVPEWSEVVFVTSNRVVFWSHAEDAAVNYALRYKHKLLRLQWHSAK